MRDFGIYGEASFPIAPNPITLMALRVLAFIYFPLLSITFHLEFAGQPRTARVASDLSPKTIHKQVDYIWALGGCIKQP